MRLPLRAMIAVCAVAVLLGAGAFALAMYSNDQTSKNSVVLQSLVLDVKALLLNGHTASAIRAKQTKREVGLLLQQQRFDHAQSVHGNKRLRAVIREVEHHLDRTIKAAITRAALRTVRELRR